MFQMLPVPSNGQERKLSEKSWTEIWAAQRKYGLSHDAAHPYTQDIDDEVLAPLTHRERAVLDITWKYIQKEP